MPASAESLFVGQHGTARRPDGIIVRTVGVQRFDVGKARLHARCSAIGKDRRIPE